MLNNDQGHKNYYMYRDSNRTGEWTILPWDVDLSLGHTWTSAQNYFDDDAGEIVALFNREGFLKLAINHGKASSLLGMKLMDDSLMELYDQGIISQEEAMARADQKALMRQHFR